MDMDWRLYVLGGYGILGIFGSMLIAHAGKDSGVTDQRYIVMLCFRLPMMMIAASLLFF